MKKGKEKTTKTPGYNYYELIAFSGIALAILGLVSFVNFDFFHPEKNVLGLFGYYLVLPFLALLGWGTPLLFGYGLYLGFRLFVMKRIPSLRSLLFHGYTLLALMGLLATISASFTSSIQPILHKIYSKNIVMHNPYPFIEVRYYLGGILGDGLARGLLLPAVGKLGALLVTAGALIVNFAIILQIDLITSFAAMFEKIISSIAHIIKELFMAFRGVFRGLIKLPTRFKRRRPPILPPRSAPPAPMAPPKVKKTLFKRKAAKPAAPKLKKVPLIKKISSWAYPSLDFLKDATNQQHPALQRELTQLGQVLEQTMSSFGIEAHVGSIHCGPRIASFEVIPNAGVKVQKIKALEHDIALNLKAKSTRIIAPIPGKAAVGIEIPSPRPQEVSFKEILMNYQSQEKKHHIPLIIGKSAMGENVTADLAKMPHLLIAGATGSGKSVCMNTIILSLLMNASPEEVRLLMIDPKKVELTGYSKLPHMIAPVITEVHGAQAALNWLVKEMLFRYEVLKHLRLRNIHAFNSRKPNPEKEEELPIEIPKKMPFFVAIIDEFADLILAGSSDIETPIARIAQMARAVGIHMILATQRPSREVITGLIKANFPTRISFKVASKINSQIILDETGAETLLGNGDLLFLPPGTSQLTRAQGAYLSDQEISSVVNYLEEIAPTNYLIDSFDSPSFSMGDEDEPKDALFDEAKRTVIETGNASTTFLQRKLKIGYARAASLMDELELRGIVSAQEGSKPRRVLFKNEV